jgi:hypothetical protein
MQFLLFIQGSSGYANASQCYVICTLPVLLIVTEFVMLVGVFVLEHAIKKGFVSTIIKNINFQLFYNEY